MGRREGGCREKRDRKRKRRWKGGRGVLVIISKK